jgi:hypothetical protein
MLPPPHTLTPIEEVSKLLNCPAHPGTYGYNPWRAELIAAIEKHVQDRIRKALTR